MKLFFYKSKFVTFTGFWKRLGEKNAIIFSNHSEYISNFIPNLDKVEIIVTNSLDIGDACFYIPIIDNEDEMKSIIDWFKRKCSKPNLEVQETELKTDDLIEHPYIPDNVDVPHVYSITENIVEPKKEAKTKLLEVFNQMAEKENEIDAVMVVRCDDDEAEIMYASEQKTGARKVDVQSFSVQMKHLYSLLKMTTKVNDKIGSLEYVPFQFSGGIIHVTHLPYLDEAFMHDEYIFLVFVSATREGMELLKLARKRELEKIISLLKTLLS